LQIKIKKRMVYGAIAFIWIFVPAYLITGGSIGTDIINGTCVPFGAYSSHAVQMAVISSAGLIAYLLPLMLMVFCYSRIVYMLRRKVR